MRSGGEAHDMLHLCRLRRHGLSRYVDAIVYQLMYPEPNSFCGGGNAGTSHVFDCAYVIHPVSKIHVHAMSVGQLRVMSLHCNEDRLRAFMFTHTAQISQYLEQYVFIIRVLYAV